METMKKVAGRHGMTCLLHEKPFAGVNGSGKHNNWSLGTDNGVNLLDPGDTPNENIQFLLVLACILKAVDTPCRPASSECIRCRQRSQTGSQRGTAGHHFRIPW